MSIIRCARCERSIDTDFVATHSVEKPNYTNTAHPANPAFKEPVEYEEVCEPCLEREAEELGAP